MAAGSADLLGPSTLRALRLVADGAPAGTTGRWGDTNGAAMRVTPVGIAVPPEPLDRLCAAVADLDRLTHDTTVANSGAAAVAAVVSAGVGGAGWGDAVRLGVQAAAIGATHGHHVAGADVARRIGWALDLTRGVRDDALLDLVDGLVGTSLATQESVPAAFAVAAAAPDEPWRAVRLAARLGGDSDTIAAMAGAMVGACTGLSALPDDSRRGGTPGQRPAPRAAGRRTARRPGGAVTVTRLVGLCSALVDLTMVVPALPERGGDVVASSSGSSVGGGLNALAAAVAAGLPAAYAGGHGTGPFGDQVRAALAAHGIDVLLAADPDEDTGYTVVLVDARRRADLRDDRRRGGPPHGGGAVGVPAGARRCRLRVRLRPRVSARTGRRRRCGSAAARAPWCCWTRGRCGRDRAARAGRGARAHHLGQPQRAGGRAVDRALRSE